MDEVHYFECPRYDMSRQENPLAECRCREIGARTLIRRQAEEGGAQQ